MRERLRSLVLMYLSEDAKRGIIERHANSQNSAEDVLVSNLLKVSTDFPRILTRCS